MAFAATIPRQRTLLLTSSVGALIAFLSDHFPRLWATGRAAHDAPNLLSQQHLTRCTMARFRPAGRLTFFACAKKVSKETHPGIRVSLRSTSLPPVPLRGPAYKGHPWPFKPFAASMRLTPLHNTYARPPDGESARMKVSRCKHLGAVDSRLLTRRRFMPAVRSTSMVGFRCVGTITSHIRRSSRISYSQRKLNDRSIKQTNRK
jgi:hypothetical protein